MSGSRRSGAALILALLTIILLDCVVLGTLHIALQEHRIGSNRRTVLQLRLDAEGGIRRALASWSTAIDTMPAGGAARMNVPVPAPPIASVQVERLADQLFLLESVATEPPPRVGRSTASMLVRPPALPPAVDPAPAPVSAVGPIHVRASAVVDVNPPGACTAAAPPYSILASSPAITFDPGASVNAPAGAALHRPLTSSLARLAALAPAHSIASADTTIAASAAGALIAQGDVTIAPGATFGGLLVARGSITVAGGAAVQGAVHAGGGVTIDGTVQWDPCAVAAAIAAAGLDLARPAAPRAWLPSF